MSNIIHVPSFINETESQKLFKILKEKVTWEKVNYFKRHVSHYDFSIKELNNVLRLITQHFQREIIGAFLNYYENGIEYAPYHSDKYKCDTVLLSLGTERILRYRHNTDKNNIDYNLKSGDLLYVPDEVNNDYKHSLLKRLRLVESRISILIFFK